MGISATKQLQLHRMGIPRWVHRSEMVAQARNVVAQWRLLAHQVAQCRACALCETRTHPVFGVGDPNASVCVIGEAPGFYEDQQGEPFVGRAGQLLNAMLASVGFSRASVYIANVLKCRPPNNRDPLPEEVQVCSVFLQAQLKLLNPRLIVALGRHAAQALLFGPAVTSMMPPLRALRGHWHNSALDTVDCPVRVSYHPAFLLRNPGEKKHAYQDWRDVSDFILYKKNEK